MYCSSCGAPHQAGQFCVSCGVALGATPPPNPPINNTVDVTVNVGGPVLVSPQRAPKVGWSDLVRAWKQRPPSPKIEFQQVREIAEERLRTCDSLIAEIEGTVALDLLPEHAAERLQYRQALEKRAEGSANLQKAVDLPAVSMASDKLTHALAGLIATRNALTATKDKK
jgi:hypothetical protein